LGAEQTKSQQGAETKAALEELDLKERKALRAIRFTQGAATTVEALDKKREEEERRLKRAEKFGLVSADQKRQQRAQRFGNQEQQPNPVRRVVAKMEEKVQQRLVKFGLTAAAAESKDDKLAKLKARKERFAAVSGALAQTGSNEAR